MIHLLALFAAVSAQSTAHTVQDPDRYYAHGAFAQIDRHGTGSARIQALCAKGRPSDFNHLADLADRLAQQSTRDSSVTTTEDLVCTRGLLFALNARAREGPGMPIGQSWADGTMSAASTGLSRHPSNGLVAEVLGIVLLEVLPAKHPVAPDAYGERVDSKNSDLRSAAAAIYGAIKLGARSPGLYRICTSLMFDLNDFPTAHDCSLSALAAGHDSTWHLLRIASVAFTGADTITGLRAMELAALATHDGATRAELGWQLESAAAQCRACMVAGAMNPSATQNSKPGDYLSTTERSMWFALPDSGVSRWMWEAIKSRLPLHDGEGYNRLKALATPKLSAVWRQASLIPATLIRHFLYTSYGGGTFRACERDPYDISCRGIAIADDKHHVVLAADVWRVWDPTTGEPVQLVGLALPVRNLEFTGSGAARTATVDINFRQWTLPGVWRDTGLVRQFRVPESDADGTYLTSLVLPGRELPSWSLMVTQSTIRRGGLYLDFCPSISANDLELSDLILGSAEQPLTWQNDVSSVPLAPIHAFSRKQIIQLYYQIRADTARTALKVSVNIRRMVDGVPAEQSAFSTGVEIPVKLGINEIQRELDLSRLDTGVYEIGVDVQRPDGTRVHRTTPLVVQ